jgi:NTE family protein/lysophospholipid hydrolase
LALERPQVGQILLSNVAHRLRSVTGRWAREKKRIAILPAGEPMGPSNFTPRFVKALQAIGDDATSKGNIKVISRQLIHDVLEDSALGRALQGKHRERYIHLWLAAREQWYTTMIYLVENDLPWAEHCVRQADEVLWVADAAGDPALSDIELKLRDRLVTTSGGHRRRCAHRLVLQQADTSTPTQTSRWLERRRWLCMHHHVRHRNDRDVERVARFATGRAVGLVLSGGGARGFAHVGVVEALMAAGQPIDCLAGVSMGAVVASMIGQDWTPDETMDQAKRLADQFLDRTLPVVALGSARRFNRALREVYGDMELEDLWLPTMFLAANLTDADETYLESGRLREAVRASNAPAGLSPPVVTADGDLLSDGFIINNLPVDLLRRRFGCDRVIAVDVMPSRKLSPVQSYGGRGLSGFSVLWHRLNPFVRTLDMPGIQVILTRALELAGLRHQRAAKSRADRYLSPPVEQYGTFEYEAGERIRRIGLRYAANHVTDGSGDGLTASKGLLAD